VDDTPIGTTPGPSLTDTATGSTPEPSPPDTPTGTTPAPLLPDAATGTPRDGRGRRGADGPVDPRARRRQLVGLIAAGIVVIVVLLLVGFVRSRDQGPPFTGSVSAPGGGRAYRVTGWSRGGEAPIERALDAGALDEVDFVWYLTQGDGSVVVEREDLDLVRSTRERGAQALATVVNRTPGGDFDGDVAAAILASPGSRRRTIDALVDLTVDRGYDGIDIDFEAVRPEDRPKFSAFIESLAEALHDEDRILSVAVFPKTSDPGQYDLQKPYDYERLGAAVDEFKIMTYSFSGPWGEPGPQMPLEWADAVLDFAADKVPPEKTYLGVPFFGFDWSGESATAVYPGRVARLVAATNPEIGRDPTSQEATFGYTGSGGGEHTVFFQDRAAIGAKLAFLRDQHPGLAGIAIWQLYDEDPAFWKVIRTRLRKK
jgi:spore germination protein